MLHKADRLWRSFGSGLFLSVIGVFGTLMALTVFPAVNLFTRDENKRQRRIQYAVHLSFKLYLFCIRALRIADVEFVGTEKWKDLSGVMIVANHPSLLDVVMIMSQVPRAQCVVKAALWKHPFFRLTVGGAGYLRNDLDPMDLLEACRADLAAGKNLIIFPEGTRTPLGEAPLFGRGFANLATLLPCDLQLAAITNDPPALYKGHKWWKAPENRACFRLDAGEKLYIKPYLEYKHRSLGARKLAAHLQSYYAEKLGYGQSGTGPEETDRDGAEFGRSVA